jgi:dolichyl-phosphate beta-glucosyltransferase
MGTAQGADVKHSPEISVIIPAYNEQDRIAPTLRSVSRYFRTRGTSVEIIVVDDGSRDGTSDMVTEMSAEMGELRLIRLAANSGKGCAVRTGVVNALGGRIVFADADGATPIEEIVRLEAALDAGADVAIGSRAKHQDGVRVKAKLYRRVMGRAYHALVSLLTVSGIEDTQCGFKLFQAPVAQDLFCRMRMNGFSFDVEVLMMAQRGGYSIAEVPVNWTHQPGSRVNLVTDSVRMARDLFVIQSHALRGHYDQPHLALRATPVAQAPAIEQAAR